MKKLLLTLLILTAMMLVASCNDIPEVTTGNDTPTVTTGAEGNTPAVTTDAEGNTPAVTTNAQDAPTTTAPVAKPDYVVKKLTIGGVDISEFVIVLGSNMTKTEQYLATVLQNKIYDVCKVKVPCVPSTTAEQKYEILFGKTGRSESNLSPRYGLGAGRQTDSKLAFVGNGVDGNGSMMRYLQFLLSAIPAGESYDIKITDFDNLSISQPHLTETNMPAPVSEVGNYDADFYKDAENVLERFLYYLDKMPSEITVLDTFESEDFASIQNKVVFVAVDGNDSNSGTIDAPLATLAAAITKVNGGGIVYLREGVYDTTGSPVITASGTTSSPIYVTPYQDENVKLISGKQISSSDFKPLDPNDEVGARIPVSSGDSVVYASLFDLGWTKDDFAPITPESKPALLIGGITGEISRYPNADEPMLYFKKVLDTGSVTLRDNSHLYADWIKRVQNWNTWKNAGGTATTTYTIDKGLYKDIKEAVADAQKLDTVADTKYIDSYGNLNLDYGWSIKLEDLTPFRDNWVNTGDIWFYGNTYSGYRYVSCRIAEISKTQVAIISANGTVHGAAPSTNSPTGYNNYYFFNVIEALDQAGEWYLDRETGFLYIYKTDDFESTDITYCTETNPIISLKNCSNIIIDGVTISQGGGDGIYGAKCDDVVVQRCTITQLEGNGVHFENSTECAVIYCDLSDTGDWSINLAKSSTQRDAFTANRYVAQNNYVHDPRYSIKHAIYLCGVQSVASHNYLVDSNIYIDGYECVIEYNDIEGGSPDITDGGLIYLGGYDSMANHIRYNYLHDWNASNTGVYFDCLSSFNYAYYNTIDSTTAKTEFTRFLYSSTGHYNVFFGNMLVGRPVDYIAESTLFFDETATYYYTFIGYTAKFLETMNKRHSSFFAHFPEIKNFHTLVTKHVNERNQSGYVRNELEIYLCSPGGNVIMNNVILGSEKVIYQALLEKTNSVTGEKMTSTDVIRQNYSTTDISSVLGEFGNGKYDIQSSALSAVKSAIPDYRQLSLENVGLTYAK